MPDIVKCPICGKEFDREPCDYCPVCDWLYMGIEETFDEYEVDEANGISIKQAKENFKNGMDIWGDPIKNK